MKSENTIKTTSRKKSTLKSIYARNTNIPKKTEHSIQNSIIRYLQFKGFLVIRYNSGSVKTENRFTKFYTICNNGKSSGHPDLICFKDGKSYFVEVKTEKGKLTDNQVDFQRLSKQYNMTYLVIRDLKELELFLKEIEV